MNIINRNYQMNKQLLISPIANLPHAETFVGVRNSEVMGFLTKPVHGTGMWTSSWRETTQDSQWVEWCRCNDFGTPDTIHWYLLTPASRAKLFVIDGVDDLLTLFNTYLLGTPHSARPRNSFVLLDFEALASEYDGIWLTERGQRATHHSFPYHLNGWDTESTLWLQWAVAAVEEIAIPSANAH